MTVYDFMMWASLIGWVFSIIAFWIACHIITVKLLKRLSRPSVIVKTNNQQTKQADESANNSNNPESRSCKVFGNAGIIKNRLSATALSKNENSPVSQSKGDGDIQNALNKFNKLWREHKDIIMDTIQKINQIIRKEVKIIARTNRDKTNL
jgi:hypothetical protein